MMLKKSLRIICGVAALLLTLCVFASCAASDKGYDVEMPSDVEDGYENMTGSTVPSVEEKGEMADSAVKDENSSEYEPKIIKTATVYAETQNFGNAVAQIEAKIVAIGGYIEKSDVRNGRTYDDGIHSNGYASYVIRIPADSLDSFLAEAGELLNITSSSSTATDVSGQYYDIESRIKVLEGERAILEKMLENSKSVGEMIEIENRLYDVIYEIESYKTALKVYDGKVAYSTVNLYLSEVADLTDTGEITFGERFAEAVKESWNGFVDFCEDTVIFLVYAAPALAVTGVIILVLALIVLIIVKIIFASVKKKRVTK